MTNILFSISKFIIRPDGGIEYDWSVHWDNESLDWKDDFEADVSLHNVSAKEGGPLYTVVYKEKTLKKISLRKRI